MRYARLIGILILAAAAVAGAEYRIHLHDGRPVVDGVYVEGHGPYQFLVDTGAETNQLDGSLAREIGLRPKFRVEMATVSGVGTVNASDSIRLRLGTETAVTELLFTNMEAVRELSKDIRGVLGQTFLSRFDYLLDLRRRRIVFGSQRREGLRAEMEMSTGRPTVFTSLGRLVIDSGSDRLAVFDGGNGGGNILRTSNGLISARIVNGHRLFIEGREIRHVGAVSVVNPAGHGGEDGLLPVAAFDSIYFCHSESYLVFQ
jgi:hypothetical protein